MCVCVCVCVWVLQFNISFIISHRNTLMKAVRNTKKVNLSLSWLTWSKTMDGTDSHVTQTNSHTISSRHVHALLFTKQAILEFCTFYISSFHSHRKLSFKMDKIMHNVAVVMWLSYVSYQMWPLSCDCRVILVSITPLYIILLISGIHSAFIVFIFVVVCIIRLYVVLSITGCSCRH